MTILEHPDAQALLADATLSADAVRSCADSSVRLRRHATCRCFHRSEQRDHALTILAGQALRPAA